MVRSKSILFITAIWLAILLSGCVGDKNITETAKTTPAITATDTPSETPLLEVTSNGNMILVKLDGIIGFIPNIQTVKEGDEVVWENFDRVTVILFSNDELFDAKLLVFYQQYRYVFSKPGTYTFSLKNTNLNGTIIVESPATQTPTPLNTKPGELPSSAFYVTARMGKLGDWTTGNEIKYRLDTLKVNVMNQMNIPFTIKAQILSGDRILEEKTFTLEKQDSSFDFSNEKIHFINDTNVNLRLLVEGYLPIEYKFVVDDKLN
jgi:plastocyanin